MRFGPLNRTNGAAGLTVTEVWVGPRSGEIQKGGLADWE